MQFKEIVITSEKPNLTKVLQKYHFVYDFNDMKQRNLLSQNIRKSAFIIIDIYTVKDHNDTFFIVGFHDTIIIINQFSKNNLIPFFSQNKRSKIYFLSNSKESFNKDIKGKINNQQYTSDYNFEQEIESFNDKIRCNNRFILSCITGYLILNGYSNLYYDQKVYNFTNDDYVILRQLGCGSSFVVQLIYLIKFNKVFALKKPIPLNTEANKLFEREYKNYQQMKYFRFPLLCGINEEEKCLIIQYINGNTLQNIENFKFNEDEKVIIIFDILFSFQYLHSLGFVYRDLKPDNVIIDENKNVFIIDFDRMVNISELNSNQKHTIDLQQTFGAKELSSGIISYENDIYSIGQMIYYIMNEKIPQNQNESFEKNSKFFTIYQKCVDIYSKRPHIDELIYEFYKIFAPTLHKSILNFNFNIDDYAQAVLNTCKYGLYIRFVEQQNDSESLFFLGNIYFNTGIDINKSIQYFIKSAYKNNPKAQHYVGLLYYEGKYVIRNINKAIMYLSQAAMQNHKKSNFYLGIIYYDGKYIKQDIDRAAQYFLLEAKQNDPDAQYILGIIYYDKQDINNALYYFELSAKQNNQRAQLFLGSFYYDGIYIERNINKAIQYFIQASNMNNINAKLLLGLIYFDAKYIKRDMDKAIQYFTQAASMNNINAKLLLGLIYYDGKYINRDINKAIQYFTQAAKQNNSKAQFYLGLIYYEGKYTERDINKAIQYFTLSANQNNSNAMIILSDIYYEGKYVKQDINKTIQYLSIAANLNNLIAQYNLGILYFNGKQIKQDINKVIQCLTQAAKHNISDAQFLLGFIYYEGKYVIRDINKSIYYFSLSANQNDHLAKYNLGCIYYEGKYIKRDINKAVQYLTWAANQNNSSAQFLLGQIYSDGKYIQQNIKKSIHYLTLAANQNNADSQFYLFRIYYQGKKINQDINKAIKYLKLAAENNHSDAQVLLGIFYCTGRHLQINTSKGINFIFRSSEYNKKANFALGFLYHEGKYIKRDIESAIHYYKISSTFNNKFAKNNLGIIYKNGIENEVEPNIGLAIDFFTESINRFDDEVSMYNLAHIYIYNDETNYKIDDAISLLNKSLNKNFIPSISLLFIALFKKYGFDNFDIKKDKNDDLLIKYINVIGKIDSNMKKYIQILYQCYENKDFIYDMQFLPIYSESLNHDSNQKDLKICKNITEQFYEGFGI